MKKMVSAAVSAAFCLAPLAPAFAQDYRYAGFDSPNGATATANLRIPLGGKAKARPTYGLTLGYGRTMGAGLDGRTVTRATRLADLRFTTEGRISQMKVANLDLANLDRDRRMNLTGGGQLTWILVGAVAAGVAICLASDCLEGDDDDAVPN